MDIKFFESDSFDPYYNLGIEKYLFENVGSDEVILYLWQNEKTIVCGRNQNVLKECNLTELEAFGGRIARRMSGGGAVYHDLGNLNFTFIARSVNYDLAKQLGVICAALRACGIDAEVSGRNDITAHGKKFSGNAFQKDGDRQLHHGTIMIDVDTSMLSNVLNVSKKKLQNKGVDSVRSRVINLCEIKPDITVEQVKAELKNAFTHIYAPGIDSAETPSTDMEALRTYCELFASKAWIYGEKFDFTNSFSDQFAWGNIEFCINVRGDEINDIKIYSDSLHPDFISQLENTIKSKKYDSNTLSHFTDTTAADFPDCIGISKDIQELFKKFI